MELTVAIAVAGLAVSVGTFFIGRTTAAKNSGKEYGVMLTEIGYIKSGVDELKKKTEQSDRRYIELAESGVDDMKRKMEQSDERYTLLASRVQSLEEKMNMYHHGGVS